MTQRKRVWYAKYIGYQFASGYILDDIFYYEDEGKITGTGYEAHNPETGDSGIFDLKSFREIVVAGTDLPK